MWGASPDGNWVVTVAPGSTRVQPLQGGRIGGDGVRVVAGSDVPAEGAWAPDSSGVAATAFDPAPRRPRS